MVWRRRAKYEAFEAWYDAVMQLQAGQHLNLAEFVKQHRKGDPDQVLKIFREKVLKNIQPNHPEPIAVTVNHSHAKNWTFRLDLSSKSGGLEITSSTLPHLSSLVVSNLGELNLESAIIRHVVITTHAQRVDLRKCRIGYMHIVSNRTADIRLHECWIGHLELAEDGVKNLRIEGGTIRSLICPPPDGVNPIAGSADFPDVDFPTDLKPGFREGAQPYRNIRKHLEDLQNVPMANLMRTLELGTERHTDRGLNKFWNYVWGWCANYGYSPGRPLCFILGLYLAVASGLWFWDGGELIRPEDQYPGWQQGLTEGTVQRSLYLPLQSFLSPLGIFPRNLVVAATLLGKAALVVQGIATYLLIGMTAIGIRKRFKLH